MSFARTKIQLPRPRPGLLLARPALERQLVAALREQRLVLLCAPAGYGKTALLGRALDQLPKNHAVAWISLDEGDDLHRLLSCLAAALEPFDPPWRTAPEGLMAAAARPQAHQAVAEELVNTLEQCEVEHGVIVLDDLHLLDDPAGLAFLDHWLQRGSPRWTLALTSRHEPGLRLARLRAAGELTELRQQQLQFERDEVRALAAGAGLDAASADSLHQRTAGWAAGLRLALNGAGGKGRTIDRAAFEFLSSEVLDGIAPELREFLLLTSVLTDLDALSCSALTGDLHAARRLAEIERLGLFATVVDEAGHILRLHALFREALQHRLLLERPQQRLEVLERAAALEPDPVRRQALLLAAERHEPAARALLAAGPGLITQGGVNTLLHLCDQFPPGFAERSAELQLVSGLALWLVWDLHAAERHMAAAETLFLARGDAASAQVARAYRAATLIGLGRLGAAGEALAPLQRLAAAELAEEAQVITRVALTWHAMESGALHRVAPEFEALLAVLEQRPSLEAWYMTVPPPRQTLSHGAAAPAARWAAGALAVTGERPVPLRPLALLTQSWLALWQGRWAAAAELLARAEADAQWTGQQVVARSHSLANRAMQQALQSDGAAALAAMRTRLAEHPPGYGDWGRWHLLFFACRIAVAGAAVEALRDWLAQMRDLQPGLPDASAARLRPLLPLQAQLAWLEGRGDAAIAGWREALLHEENIDLLGQAAETRVCLALALLRRDATAEAAEVLAPALAADEPGGALLAGAAALQELAGARWGRGLDEAQQARLQAWAALRPGVAQAGAKPLPAGGPERDRLSQRELEVLALIAQGDSNKLIARALDLSPHTVKRHVAHILEKLALASRGHAAAWHREQAARRPG